MKFYRISFGEITPQALERILKAIASEVKSDELEWSALETTDVHFGFHPRNASCKWRDVEDWENL
jgi:hypothetical protein